MGNKTVLSKMKLAIVGSRNFNNSPEFSLIVGDWIRENGPPLEIISGGAAGVDTLAEHFARGNNIPFIIYPADWQRYGKSAGHRRNTQIIDHSTHLLALPGPRSIGTWDSIRKAQAKGIPLTINQVRD